MGPSRELAEAFVKDQANFVFVGDGPNYATALFSAAKVIEAAGRHAMGQDTEEWAHLQYFVNVDPATPTFLISPNRRGHARCRASRIAKRIGRTVVAVVPGGGDTAVAGAVADWTLPVVGDVPEIFSPMVYAVAGEIFSAHLSQAIGEPPSALSLAPQRVSRQHHPHQRRAPKNSSLGPPAAVGGTGVRKARRCGTKPGCRARLSVAGPLRRPLAVHINRT